MKFMEKLLLKNYDNTASGTIAFTGTIMELSNMSQGNTNGTRVGNQIELKGVATNFIFQNNSSINVEVRMIIFRYLGSSNSTTTPTVTDVLWTNNGSTINASTPLMDYDKTRQSLIVPLVDRRFTLEGDGGVATNNPLNTFHSATSDQRYIKMDGNTITYNSGTSGTDGQGKLYVLLVSSVNATMPVFYGYSRLLYYNS